MKKIVALLCVLAFGYVQAEQKLVNFLEMTQSQIETFQEAMIRQTELEQTVIVFNEGARILIDLFLNSDYFHLGKTMPTEIEVKKSFYLKVSNGQFLFSNDLKTFEPFEQFFTGRIGVDSKEFGRQIGLRFGGDVFKR